MNAQRIFQQCSLLITSLFWMSAVFAEPWTPNLTNLQQKELQSLLLEEKHSVFAAAESGAWGSAWRYSSLDEARSIALSNCRCNLSKGDLDCAIIAENGSRDPATTFSVSRVSQIYSPVNGKKASKFFGLPLLAFVGDPKLAREQYISVMKDRRNFHPNAELQGRLSKLGLVPHTPTGWGIYLSETKAYHYASPHRKKVIESDFESWGVTKEGLLCMFYGRYGDGRLRPITCMIIASIQNGNLRYNWAFAQGNNMRKGFVVAGNPILTSVK